MNTPHPEPLTLLQQLADASCGEKPHELVRSGVWHGLVLRLAGVNLVVPVTDDLSIVPNSATQPLPLCREWVKGMLHIHGEIYTVIDFAQFVGQKLPQYNASAKILLWPNHPHKNALLLTDQIRLTSFNRDLPLKRDAEVSTEVSYFPAAVVPFLRASWLDGDEKWGVIDISALMNAENLVNIG